jgi:putative aldouronate transport system permease protein
MFEGDMKAKIGVRRFFKDNWRLYALILPALVWLGFFAYAPMYGLIIAFKTFRPRLGITGSPWSEPLFRHFIDFFSTAIAFNTIANTIILSLLTILISFPVPIVFAILLNQIRGGGGGSVRRFRPSPMPPTLFPPWSW